MAFAIEGQPHYIEMKSPFKGERKFDLRPRQAIIARAMLAVNSSRDGFVYGSVVDVVVGVFSDELPDKIEDHVRWEMVVRQKVQDVNRACIVIADELRKLDVNSQTVFPNMAFILEYAKAQPEYQGLSNEELALVIERKILFPQLQQKMLMQPAQTIEAPRQNEKLTGEQVQSLVKQSISGDKEAFGQLYAEYVGRIYRQIYYRVGNPEIAEDITSQVFESAYKAIERYREMGRPFIVWLLVIANHMVIDFYRNNKKFVYMSDLTVAAASQERKSTVDPEDIAEINFENEELRKAILRLTPVQRAVVVMRFLEEMPFAEIGVVMGRTASNVRVIQYRALAVLKRILGGEDPKSSNHSSQKKSLLEE